MIYLDLVGIHLTLLAQCASYETCFMSYMNGWFNVGLVQGHVLYYVLYEPHDCMQCNPITIILTLKI